MTPSTQALTFAVRCKIRQLTMNLATVRIIWKICQGLLERGRKRWRGLNGRSELATGSDIYSPTVVFHHLTLTIGKSRQTIIPIWN
jgi:hypothetical protein